MFNDACDFVLGGGFLFQDKSTEEFDEIKYSILLQLQDLGLVNMELGLTITLAFNDEGKYHLVHRDCILTIVSSEDLPNSLEVPAVRITPVGLELYQFVEARSNLDYQRCFASFLGELGYQLYRTDDFVVFPDGHAQFDESDMTLVDHSLE